MPKLISQCPSCQGEVRVTHMACANCQTRFEGQFPIPPFLRLSPDDQAFILAFVKTSGSLKEMSKQMGVSYPTIRNRLDQVIESLHAVTAEEQRDSREQIIQALETGGITPQEAARRLRDAES